MTFGQQLSAALKSKGLTQRALAQRLGCSEALVSHIVSDKCSPTVRTMLRVAAALEMRLVVMLDNRPEEE